MTRTEYSAQLDALRSDVVDLGESVGDRWEAALGAVEAADGDRAAAVVQGDREINTRYLALEHDCIDLFALQQPVAGDLRFVASTFKILTDLERVGDLAANVARAARAPPLDRFPDVDVVDAGREAGELLQDAMAAYAAEDAQQCWEIAARDDDLDARCADTGETVVTALMQTDGPSRAGPRADRDLATGTGDRPDAGPGTVLDDAWRTLLLVRDVERVGDHAVNVAARTLYAVEHDDSLLF